MGETHKEKSSGIVGYGEVVWPLAAELQAALVTGEQEKTEQRCVE